MNINNNEKAKTNKNFLKKTHTKHLVENCKI